MSAHTAPAASTSAPAKSSKKGWILGGTIGAAIGVTGAAVTMALMTPSDEKTSDSARVDSWDQTPSGEFVESTNATNLGKIATSGKAVNFLNGMLKAVESPRELGGPGTIQSFDNLYEFIQIKIKDPKWTGLNDDKVKFEIDYGDEIYVEYTVAAAEKGGSKRIFITYSGNVVDTQGKMVYGNLEFMRNNTDKKIYLINPDGDRSDPKELNRDEFIRIIDKVVPN